MVHVSKCSTGQCGFTLVELMIVIAIIGIISTIAYPSYQGFVQSANRGAAQADLMAFAAAMERHKAAVFSYKGAAEGASDTGKPTVFHSHSPSAELTSSKKYDLTISTVSASGSGYQLKASPVSGGLQAGDGELILFSDGRRAWDKDGSGSISGNEYCWRC
jgi:type IV pilus assembly protein PilE